MDSDQVHGISETEFLVAQRFGVWEWNGVLILDIYKYKYLGLLYSLAH